MDIRLALMCGIDIPIEELRLIIHQPTIKEIAFVGEEKFFMGIQTLTITKEKLLLNVEEQDKTLLENTTNFQIFMTVMSEQQAADKKFAVQQVLALFFPKQQILFTPRSLIFSGETDQIIIDETNFNVLQEIIAQICCLSDAPGGQQEFNPQDEKAREIARKLMRGRQRVAAQRKDGSGSIFSQYLSILTIGLHISLHELMQNTIFQVYDLIERYSLYMNWDIDLRAKLAGGGSDDQPENWMKNIH